MNSIHHVCAFRRSSNVLQLTDTLTVTLPLWTPSQVVVGAVGYHSKSEGGKFITLFDAFEPAKSSNGRTKDMPSLYGYGRVDRGSQRQDKRNVAQRGMDLIQSWLSSRNNAKYACVFSCSIARRIQILDADGDSLQTTVLVPASCGTQSRALVH